MENFKTALSYYLIEIQKKQDVTYKDHPNANPDVTYSEGKRYIRVIRESYSQKSVHSFVDKTNGDILKGASWNTPAKGKRGNIFDADNGASALSEYGVKYLR